MRRNVIRPEYRAPTHEKKRGEPTEQGRPNHCSPKVTQSDEGYTRSAGSRTGALGVHGLAGFVFAHWIAAQAASIRLHARQNLSFAAPADGNCRFLGLIGEPTNEPS